MQRLKKIFLLTVLLGLLSAIESYSVGSSCYQVHNTRCSTEGSTRTCYLVPGGHPLPCYCWGGRWECPVEP